MAIPVSSEEIILNLEDTRVEKEVNIEIPNPELLESSPQELKNSGLILQNSITPIKGLNYNSIPIPKEKDIPDRIPSTEEEK